MEVCVHRYIRGTRLRCARVEQVIDLPRVPCIGETICIGDDSPGGGDLVTGVAFRLNNIPWVELEDIDVSDEHDDEFGLMIESEVSVCGWKVTFHSEEANK